MGKPRGARKRRSQAAAYRDRHRAFSGDGKAVAKKTASTGDDVIVIKKYANRRLYNTATSSYVTLDHLCEMVKQGKEFTVHDAKTNEDITRSVLAQIIFEEEGKSGQNLLPIKFLRQLIRFYGDSLQGFIPSYLELSMDSFAREQEKLRGRIANAFGGGARLGQFEEQIKQNFAMFDSAMRMFSPFANRQRAERGEGVAAGEKDAEEGSQRDSEIDELKRQLAAMQAQLESLAKK
ncbi:MAG: polyhydroxyalkanoate synthesis repressor PhaR [Parvibaculum sp.]|nr:polyhydroxyalkanoate synthesis repressor PhaR [Parvibaculum sp.]